MMRKWPIGLVLSVVLGAGVGLAVSSAPAVAQDQTKEQGPRQSDAAPSTADTPPAVVAPPPAGAAPAAPRVLTAPPATPGATAETPRAEPAPDPKARFQFVRIGDSVLKLDSASGEISLCSARSLGWGCQLLPEDRLALDKEIGRLQSEVESLKGEVAAMKLAALPPPPPPPPLPGPPPAVNKPLELKLPTAQDYERARAFAEDTISVAWRRLVEMIGQIQSDVMRKG